MRPNNEPSPEINDKPIRYYQVTSNPRQEKVYPLHTFNGLPALPLKSEMLTWYTYVRVKVLTKSGAAQLHPNSVNVYI